MEIFVEISTNLNKEVVYVYINECNVYLNQTEIRRNHIFCKLDYQRKKNRIGLFVEES